MDMPQAMTRPDGGYDGIITSHLKELVMYVVIVRRISEVIPHVGS